MTIMQTGKRVAPTILPALTRSAREQLAALKRAIASPERWVLLSACDWHPDGFGYPTNLAALSLDTGEERPGRQR